ncbi:Protein N-acetyltransferase, RimJ/RimL family [Nocardioides alpinus]|uniref:N-acetyltransferase n=1 Tax=Nocardioides alpinus TaxID=748909 RepID=A0A1I1ACU3_9ACTN|nr:GNAT family N-acetyltransferase [Nocardioides alpinus]PKH43408.1 N-acetyltransferase [Nocardioides alpinus]SFB34338.1 Protein N-acetyltransferase, RimJ/RimL family [Nocardioides alpinus]
MRDWRHVRTDRLRLDRPVQDDLADLHRIHADPDSWAHFPQGRHLDLDRTRQTLSQSEVDWARGLGYWSVRDSAAGPVVGMAGCTVAGEEPWWNLYYRFDSSVRGRGYAAEAAGAALEAARDVAPDRPVLAYLLEINVASRRTAEKVGLSLVWSGPDAGNDDPDAVRLVYLDREPDDAIRAALDVRFTPRPTV